MVIKITEINDQAENDQNNLTNVIETVKELSF